jgi:uncharacterized protein (UPF0128 family)
MNQELVEVSYENRKFQVNKQQPIAIFQNASKQEKMNELVNDVKKMVESTMTLNTESCVGCHFFNQESGTCKYQQKQ